jgi:hypothetical protein
MNNERVKGAATAMSGSQDIEDQEKCLIMAAINLKKPM